MSITKFQPATIDELKYYVYRLIDPRNGQTFYVGKGKGNRIFHHVNRALQKQSVDAEQVWNPDEDEVSAKYQQIMDIQSAGLEVIHVIHRYGMNSDTAYEVESALIDCYPGLTNQQAGHGNDKGVCNADELDRRCNISVFSEKDIDCKFVIIKVRQSFIDERNSLYEAVRHSWVADIDRIKNYKYVFASVDGIVNDVFQVDKWESNPNYKNRVLFEGKSVGDLKPWSNIKGKRIPERFRKKGLASPLLYSDMKEHE